MTHRLFSTQVFSTQVFSTRLGATAGWLAVGAFLLLASPGVRVAGAEDSAAAEFESFVQFTRQDVRPEAAPAPGPVGEETCQAAEGHAQRAAAGELMAQIQRLRAEKMRPGVAGVEVGDGIVLLNNRGFNYGPGPVIDPNRLATELRLRQ